MKRAVLSPRLSHSPAPDTSPGQHPCNPKDVKKNTYTDSCVDACQKKYIHVQPPNHQNAKNDFSHEARIPGATNWGGGVWAQSWWMWMPRLLFFEKCSKKFDEFQKL